MQDLGYPRARVEQGKLGSAITLLRATDLWPAEDLSGLLRCHAVDPSAGVSSRFCERFRFSRCRRQDEASEENTAQQHGSGEEVADLNVRNQRQSKGGTELWSRGLGRGEESRPLV